VVISTRDAPGLKKARPAALRRPSSESKPFGKIAPVSRRRSDRGWTATGSELICLGASCGCFSPPISFSAGTPMLNIHPSLLASFPRLESARPGAAGRGEDFGRDRAFRDCCTDRRPILMQGAVAIFDHDTRKLAERVLGPSTAIYPLALAARRQRPGPDSMGYLQDPRPAGAWQISLISPIAN